MNDTDHKIRVVAEWAGLWKPTTCERDEPDRNRQCWKCNEVHPSPPRLLEAAGAWALLMALRKQKYNVVIDGTLSRVQIWRDGMHGSVITTIRDDNDAEAVFYAAYQLATKEATMTFNEAIKRCTKIMNADGPMQVGVRGAFVFANAVVVIAMKEGRELSIQVSGLNPSDVFPETIDDVFEAKEQR